MQIKRNSTKVFQDTNTNKFKEDYNINIIKNVNFNEQNQNNELELDSNSQILPPYEFFVNDVLIDRIIEKRNQFQQSIESLKKSSTNLSIFKEANCSFKDNSVLPDSEKIINDEEKKSLDQEEINIKEEREKKIDDLKLNEMKLDKKSVVTGKEEDEDNEVECMCTKKEHVGKEVLNIILNFPIDYLFECLITGNEFSDSFRKKRKIWEYTTTDWSTETVDDKQIKSRKINYKMSLNEVKCLGHKFASNVEYEKLIECVPKKLYIIDCDAYSNGPPYADTFYFKNRYCLTRINANSCRLVVHNQFLYQKTVFFAVRGLIERVSIGGAVEYYNDLAKHLEIESERFLNKLNKCVVMKDEDSNRSNNDSCSSTSSKSDSLSLAQTSSVSEFSIKNIDKDDKSINNELAKETNSVLVKRKSNEANFSKQNSITIKEKQNEPSSKEKKTTHFKRMDSSLIKNHNQCDPSLLYYRQSSKNVSIYSNNSNTNYKEILLCFILVLIIFLLGFNYIIYNKLSELQNLANAIRKHPKYSGLN